MYERKLALKHAMGDCDHAPQSRLPLLFRRTRGKYDIYSFDISGEAVGSGEDFSEVRSPPSSKFPQVTNNSTLL